MIGMILKLFRGHVRQHALEIALCVVGIALGVAVVVGIDLAVDASVNSFRGAVRTLADRATHAIAGVEGSVRDEQFIDLRQRLPNLPLAPVIDRRILAHTAGGDVTVRLFGVDPFSERGMRSITRVDGTLDDTARDRFLSEPDVVVLTAGCAELLGVGVGDTLSVTAGDQRRSVEVIGTVDIQGPGRAQLDDVVIADLATAQELVGLVGRLDRIDAVLDDDAERATLQAALPEGLSLRSTDDRAQQLNELIGAYRLNLMALSLMASFVAVFIVYNALLVSVQQRLTSLAILRCLGASRAQLAMVYLVEALLLALVGGAIGLVGGWALSHGLVQLVGNTINELYASVRPAPVMLDAFTAAKGLGVALLAGLVGAAVPLVHASRTPPVSVMRPTEQAGRSHRIAWTLAGVGAALLAIQPLVYALPGDSPIAGFVMALSIALGAALVCPLLMLAVCRVVQPAARAMQWVPVQSAAGGVSRSLGITGTAVAAMMLAGAMSVGIQTMVTSFRSALGGWMDQRFRFDVFVGPQLLVDHRIDAPLPEAAEAWVRSQPAVQRVVRYRLQPFTHQGRAIEVVATDASALLEMQSLQLKSQLEAGTSFDPSRDALVSEPLAFRERLHAGDTLALDTPSGPRSFRVFAVYHDFGSERGQVMLELPTYADAWNDPRLTSLHVRLVPGAAGEAVAAAWQRELGATLPVVVQHYAGLKRDVTAVFDRTFRVTDVLSWLAGAVAFCGLAGALLALALARRREYGVLAALGMSPRQTSARVMSQGLLIAVVAAVVACLAGTVLAYVLAYVIQYRSFGWSIPTSPQPQFWWQVIAVGVVAAVLAAAYPVRVLRNAPPAESIRS
jgi:putative ABC transport system permease protein